VTWNSTSVRALYYIAQASWTCQNFCFTKFHLTHSLTRSLAHSLTHSLCKSLQILSQMQCKKAFPKSDKTGLLAYMHDTYAYECKKSLEICTKMVMCDTNQAIFSNQWQPDWQMWLTLPGVLLQRVKIPGY